MRSIRRLVLIAAFSAATVFLACSSDPALADKRVALVVGNSAYQNVAKLPNPANDASSVAQMFKNAGFDIVDLQLDLGNLDFKRAIRRFEDAASDADMAVVFFAGHGLELRGTNYMIPVDARLADDRDAPDEAIPLDRIVEAVDGAKRLRLVIVDACRDNPFAVNMKRLASLRTVSRGLARVEPQSTDTLIAYAARAGSTAEDGHGDHSPLTTALLDNLTAPGLDIRLAFGRVRDEVLKITGNRQEPFVYGSLGGGVVSLVPPSSQPKEPLAADVKGDYELVREIGTKKAWEVFLNTYKTGFYSDLAAAQLGKLIAAEQGAKVATLEPPTPPSPSPAVPSSDEQRAWDRIKDSGDQAALQDFIKRYPRSPLALNAQKRLETLQQIAREREDKARADREAAQQRAEEERRAKAAEAERLKAEQQAKAAEAERQKAEQQAKAAEAERQKAEQAKAAEAERQKAEQQAKAAEAERQKAEQAKAAEAERQKAEQQAKAAEAERQKAEQAKAAEAERQKAAQTAPTEPNGDLVTPGSNPNNAAAAAPPAPSPAEARAWDQIKDSDKQAALQDFIKRYPKSPLVPNAQKRLETLQQIAQEREEKARADREAAQQRAEEERRAKAAEIERQKAEKAAEAERQKAEQQAALQAKAAEAERLKAEKAAAAERQKAEQQAALEAKAAEAARQKAEQQAALEAKAAEAARQKAEQQAALEAKAPEAARQKAEKPAAPVVESNTSELIHAAQVELSRLGCFSGKPDGTLNAATKTGINRYLSRRGSPDPDAVVTESFVSELRDQQLKNCQLDCPSGQKADGDTCVASKKSPQNSKSARQHDDVQDKPKASRQPAKQETRQADKKPERPERPAAAPQPQVHQEVSSTPHGSGSMIGVGF